MDMPISGCGLGLRPEFVDELLEHPSPPIDFLEIAPENWLTVGGARKACLERYADKFPIICHGLSLSIGSPQPLNESFILQLKHFFKTYGIRHYSEHLSFCSDSQGQLYDLFPMPFTPEAADYVADRVKQVQDLLGMQISLENISYYTPLATEMTELEFIHRVLEKADCALLLDVNNIYVNSVNHGYDANDFLSQLPGDRIAYIHIAGHKKIHDGLLMDTHGAEIIDPVYDLLAKAYSLFGELPTLLERDNEVPSLHVLFDELSQIRALRSVKAEEVTV